MSSNKDTDFIYLLHRALFKEQNKNIYKIGRTRQPCFKRIQSYEKGSELIIQTKCKDCISLEKNLIDLFKTNFKQELYHGTEYFSGNWEEMRRIINSAVDSEEYQPSNLIKIIDTKLDERSESNISDSDELSKSIDDNDELVKTVDDSDELSKYIDDSAELSESIDDNDEIVKTVDDSDELSESKNEMREMFPDYLNDESYGGIKRYILIKQNTNLSISHEAYYVYFISRSIGLGKIVLSKNCLDHLDYFEKILKNKIIKIDKLYDINSDSLNKKIISTKSTIDIKFFYYSSHISVSVVPADNIYIKLEDKINKLLLCNVIINNNTYGTIESMKSFQKIKDFEKFQIDIGGMKSFNGKTICKIKSTYYYYNCLKDIAPYQIKWNVNGDYYVLNREYTYIGTGEKSLDKIDTDFVIADSKYIHNQVQQKNKYDVYKGKLIYISPFENEEVYQKTIQQFIDITKDLNKCLNPSNFMSELLGLI